MNDLPNDVLDVISGHLGSKSLARFACTCRAARRAVDRTCRVKLTSKAAIRWAVPKAERVWQVAVWRVRESAAWLSAFHAATHVSFNCSLVPPSLFHHLPLEKLRHLRVHRICSPPRHACPPIFTTATLAGDRCCPMLEVLSLTFTPLWAVVVDDGPPRLRTLEIRAGDVHVRTIPNERRLETLGIAALRSLRAADDASPLANADNLRDYMLECGTRDLEIPRALVPRRCAGTMRIVSLHATGLDDFADVEGVERACFLLRTAFIDGAPPTLRRLDIVADHLIVASGLPDRVDVCARVGGEVVPRSLFRYTAPDHTIR
jgi:hypothetical protein